MMKRIGCVIAYKKDHTNYGTSLVGYALLRKLQQLGYDVEVIHYVKKPTIGEVVSIAINQVRVQGVSKFLKRFLPKPSDPDYVRGIKLRTDCVEAYKAKNLEPLFHDFVGFKALCEGSKKYDAVVVGSDQVWLPSGLKTKFFNLLFVDDSVRKVSYASSFGVSEIPRFQRRETAKYLDRFHAISVRENKGKEIVESLSKNKATIVADPTLLLSGKEWQEEAKDAPINKKEPYIFCYFLGANPVAREAANQLRARTGYKIITLRHMDEYIKEDDSFGDEAPYDVDPKGFVRLISDADYVCTDSFHCSAFSIQFHRKFMTFYRFGVGEKGGRNSRIDSLFDTLSIPKDHIYQGDIMKIEDAVDWEKVDKKLESLRLDSLGFITKALV